MDRPIAHPNGHDIPFNSKDPDRLDVPGLHPLTLDRRGAKKDLAVSRRQGRDHGARIARPHHAVLLHEILHLRLVEEARRLVEEHVGATLEQGRYERGAPGLTTRNKKRLQETIFLGTCEGQSSH